jgi:hypothetical protein
VFSNPLTEMMADFVRSVGINVQSAVLDRRTVFPGLEINCGAVLVDESRLLHPGNILHEAGHIAVHDPKRRAQPKFSPRPAEEVSAMAWSYAAIRYLCLDAEIVFYPGSYQGWAPSLIQAFGDGRYIGVPLLQLYGMTLETRRAAERGLDPYPHMLRWLR